jgi:Icc-related predicted phosphoesterase
MNDYRLIYTERDGATTRITVEDTNRWHQEDLSWLLATLEDIQDKGHKALVVTHHLPTYELIGKRFKGHPLNCCFASALDSMIERLQPLAWICGHSHLAGRAKIGATQLALNPHGYPGESVPTRNKNSICEILLSQ